MSEMNQNEAVTKGNLIKKVDYRPRGMAYLCLPIGIGLLLGRTVFYYIAGGILIAIAILMLFVLKEMPVLDIYENGVEVYENYSRDQASFYSYDQIAEWSMRSNPSNRNGFIWFKLNNGQELYKETYQAQAAFDALYKLMGPKETGYKQRKKLNSDKKAGKSLKDRLAGIVNIFRK